jgi:hypothetical protein
MWPEASLPLRVNLAPRVNTLYCLDETELPKGILFPFLLDIYKTENPKSIFWKIRN